MIRSLHALPLVTLLAACSLAPAYERPDVATAENWRGGEAGGNDVTTAAMADPAWWEQFGSHELSALVAAAFARNTDLEAALSRVAEARAALRIAGADRLPAIDASGRIAKDWTRPFEAGTSSTDGYSGQAILSYEVDLWGRVADSVRAARLRRDAAAFAEDALRLVVAADVVQGYGQILALNDQLRITRERLENAQEIYRIVAARFREGAASGLELAQQHTELANFEATLASIEQQRLTAINQLAVLTGAAPQGFAEPTAALATLAAPPVAALPPALLLTRRPDIREAEAQLAAAHADIGVARAAFFPALVVGGDAGLVASPVGSAVTTAAGIAASLSAPIFAGGRISGNVARTKARRDELVAIYRGAVLTAFQEAEDALAALTGAEKRYAAYTVAAEQARIAYRLSRDRFDAGGIDFLTLLDAQRSLLQAEDNLVQARYDRIGAAVRMFKAMGGGWSDPTGTAPAS